MNLTDPCVHCGFCLPSCASYRVLATEMDSPRGRIHALKALAAGELELDATVASHFDSCLGCYACVTACPSGVRYDELIEALRPQLRAPGLRSPWQTQLRQLLLALLPYPQRLRALLTPLRPYAGSGLQRLARRSGLTRLLGPELAAMEKLLPALGAEAFGPDPEGLIPASGPRRARVGLVLGCVQRLFDPEVNAAAIRVLTANGIEVLIPRDQGCCGAVSHHQGEEAQTQQLAEALIKSFEAASAAPLDAVLVAASGCGHTLKAYGRLTGKTFSAPVADIQEFLHQLGLSDGFRAGLKPLPHADGSLASAGQPLAMVFHDACHMLHGQGIGHQPRELLAAIPHIQLREAVEAGVCCGSAGIYNLVQPQEAAELGRIKAADLSNSGAELVVSANIGCSLQIREHLGLQGPPMAVLHPMQLLDWSFRGIAPARRGQIPKPTARPPASGKLLSILGLGFGLAGAVGGTIGAGLLRTPGLVAAQLGSPNLVIAAWLVGGLYALLGAICVAEMGASLPLAGGWYVYAHRAFGNELGFVVGWTDWLGHCVGLAWVAITIGEYGAALVPGLGLGPKAIALACLLLFSLIQLLGVRAGSGSQQLLSLAKAVAFLALVAACFLWHGNNSVDSPAVLAPAAHWSDWSMGFDGPGLAIAGVLALQAVITTYDGWASPIYFAEEFSEPASDLPRSLLGGVLAVIVIYLLVNLALLHVLPMEQLANSKLPVGDAATVIFGSIGGELITGVALISLLGLVNTAIMAAPRILFGMARDGLFPAFGTLVNAGGTPSFALLITSLATIALVASGSFERLLGMASILYVAIYMTGIAAQIMLRQREPALPRPYGAWGYPVSALLVLGLSLAFLIGAAFSDPLNSLIALALVAIGALGYLIARRFQLVPA